MTAVLSSHRMTHSPLFAINLCNCCANKITFYSFPTRESLTPPLSPQHALPPHLTQMAPLITIEPLIIARCTHIAYLWPPRTAPIHSIHSNHNEFCHSACWGAHSQVYWVPFFWEVSSVFRFINASIFEYPTELSCKVRSRSSHSDGGTFSAVRVIESGARHL